MKIRHLLLCAALVALSLDAAAIDNPGITVATLSPDRFTLIENGLPVGILSDSDDNSAVRIAVSNLSEDFRRVSGTPAAMFSEPRGSRLVVVGTLESKHIAALVKAGKLDAAQLQGKTEKYLMTTVSNPFDGVEEALVIAGSDRRGTVYGIYELSEQIGVSPWYDWMDVPTVPRTDLSIARGTYTAGEPAVRYRGIFLNDEAPCLTGWVKNTYGTDYGDHRFYARVFELILRLRGNFMWPAMWGWSFYADDPENSRTAHEMGVIMGTSHHEPMARNHQEWARKRGEYGAWDYASNQKVIDRFFREGIERSKDNEDLITIGMRGDGDAPMGGAEGKDHEFTPNDKYYMDLMRKIFRNQRRIIQQETGRPAKERQQVWAVYKEVQRYYDLGLRPADDVIILLSDDNWGDVRHLPNEEERKHPGGWGMYYHVDYVGAPRNTKWLNVTPIQHMWEQMQATYAYGVEKLWVLNVGDLKPMEYPITLFLDMAWNPTRFTAENLLDHTRDFCARQFGEDQAEEAARIFNLYSKYAGRVTAEMLDRNTYNIHTGEWKQVCDEFVRLEAEALRQYVSLPEQYRDAYKQLILFPVQALANVYELYYAQAMNHKLYAEGNPAANDWADKAEQAFERDKALHDDYNLVMAGGKWNGMMRQKHIGYTSWNDNFPADILPELRRIESPETATGGYIYTGRDGYVAMEAEHYHSCQDPGEGKWTVIPYLGRTLSAMTVMPYTVSPEGAQISYRFSIPETSVPDSVTVHVVVKSTLAFARSEGHRYTVGFEGSEAAEVNYNHDLNEEPENVYTKLYPTVAGRVIEKTVTLPLPAAEDGLYTLQFCPLDPGTVLEKIVVDYGGYVPSFLFGEESSCSR